MSNLTVRVKERALKASGLAFTVGLVGLLVSIALLFVTGSQAFFQSYLTAYILPSGLAIGCLALLMIQHVSGGYWGYVVRRPCEAGARTLPFVAIMFLPLFLGLTDVYKFFPKEHEHNSPEAHLNVHSDNRLWAWSDPDLEIEDHEKIVLDAKKGYLSDNFFIIRTVGAFALWIGMGLGLSALARVEDSKGWNPSLKQSMQYISGPGIVVHALVILLISTDWSMSLQPIWYSTMYPVIFGFGQILSAMALNSIVFIYLRDGGEDLNDSRNRKILRDLGSFLLGFTVFWTYITFSQFLLIWSANLKEEVPYYLARSRGGWEYLTWALGLGHFLIPFLVLLFREAKRRADVLWKVAVFILVMRFADIYWQIRPAFDPGHWDIGLETVQDLASFTGLMGIWIGLFFREVSKYGLYPENDPRKDTEPVHTVADDVIIPNTAH